MRSGFRRASAIKEAKILEPHMLSEREAMAMHRYLMLSKKLNLHKRERFGRETCLPWRQEVGES